MLVLQHSDGFNWIDQSLGYMVETTHERAIEFINKLPAHQRGKYRLIRRTEKVIYF